MFLESFKITSGAVFQIFLLSGIGYLLLKRNVLSPDGLNSLSKLVIEITLPVWIFSKLVEDFKFSLYPNWWVFPLMGMAITALGLLIGSIFTVFIKGIQSKQQFLSLVTFQNAGYLPLALVNALLPADKAGSMLIYIFLFLLGFNLVMWSLGPYILSFHKKKSFELGSLFSPPVIAILSSLAFIFLGLNKFTPELILRPLRVIGDCTIPLALFVVGGNLATLRLQHIDKKAMFCLALTKLIIMPALGLVLIIKFRLPELLGLLMLMELAVPSATSLSLIIRHYQKEDSLISQGIFFSHIVGILTIPLFLSLYFTLVMVR